MDYILVKNLEEHPEHKSFSLTIRVRQIKKILHNNDYE